MNAWMLTDRLGEGHGPLFVDDRPFNDSDRCSLQQLEDKTN